jgi:hypothetical protein
VSECQQEILEVGQRMADIQSTQVTFGHELGAQLLEATTYIDMTYHLNVLVE